MGAMGFLRSLGHKIRFFFPTIHPSIFLTFFLRAFACLLFISSLRSLRLCAPFHFFFVHFAPLWDHKYSFAPLASLRAINFFFASLGDNKRETYSTRSATLPERSGAS
jgi:hypothetical protein